MVGGDRFRAAARELRSAMELVGHLPQGHGCWSVRAMRVDGEDQLVVVMFCKRCGRVVYQDAEGLVRDRERGELACAGFDERLRELLRSR